MTQACWLSIDSQQACTKETKVSAYAKHTKHKAIKTKPIALRVESVLVHDRTFQLVLGLIP